MAMVSNDHDKCPFKAKSTRFGFVAILASVIPYNSLMRKEVLISILVGLFLGLVITYGFYTAKLSTQTADVTKKQDIEQQPTSVPESSAIGKLKISAPEDESLTTSGKINLIGQTDKNSFVVISLLDLVRIITSDDSGKFSQEVQLKPGGNIIEVKTLDENGAVSSATRSIFFDDGLITVASGSATTIKPTATPQPKITPKPTAKITPKPTAKPTAKPTIKP